jgi:hypothetical protein
MLIAINRTVPLTLPLCDSLAGVHRDALGSAVFGTPSRCDVDRGRHSIRARTPARPFGATIALPGTFVLGQASI